MKKQEITEELLDELSSIISEYLPKLNKRNLDASVDVTSTDGCDHILKLKYDTNKAQLTVKYQPKMD